MIKERWISNFKFDPISALLDSNNQAIKFFVRRDLIGGLKERIEEIWQLPEPRKTLRRQEKNGSWSRPGKLVRNSTNHNLIETWKRFRILVGKYEFNRENIQIERAAEYIFSCQTEDGDIRGMIGNQYATYYSGAFFELLIKAGYGDSPRIDNGFQWLLSMQQENGGWSIPMITHKFDRETQYSLTTEDLDPVEPDRTKPFSHNATGMILRAFASHSHYRYHPDAIKAGNLLKSRFFQKDAYTSYQAASYWVRFEYPFWWNNLISALDTLSLLGFKKDDVQIDKALGWLIDHQQEDGLWLITYAKPDIRDTPKNREMKLWVSLAICRIFMRLFS
jgi:hypothetical protein